MKAMVLAAGVGRRMLPLTLSTPKPALPVLGRPFVVQTLYWLARHGVEDAVINLHHMPERIRRILGPGTSPDLPRVHFSEEPTLLGTAGGLRRAAPLLAGAGPIVVANSDFLSDIDLGALLDAHLASDCLVTLVLAPWRPGYTVVLRDARGRITSLAGTPSPGPASPGREWLFTGCHIIDEQVLDLIPDGAPSCIVRDVYRALADERRLNSFVHTGFWWEFGSPEQYLAGCLRLLAEPPERLREICADHDPLRQLGEAIAAIGAGASADTGTRFIGRAALGYGSYVSEGSRVEDSVIMPEAWLGPGCRLRRAVIGLGVELPADFEGEAELVCLDPDPKAELVPPIERRAGLLVYPFSTARG